MYRFRKALGYGLACALIMPVSCLGWVYWQISTPDRQARLELPKSLVSLNSPLGKKLLQESLKSDHLKLSQTFQAQEKRSWCGVASAVTVLNARGASLTQAMFFTAKVKNIRSWMRVTFRGLPLGDLSKMLQAHGASSHLFHAHGATIHAFRESVKSNTQNPHNWIIVNYDRQMLGQSGRGHISPISAYDEVTDRVLLLDTNSQYPFHWIPLNQLFQAMNTPDSETGLSRGWIEIH